MMEISKDDKLFLRSVLTASPGMRQSQLPREYMQTTGDKLEYTKYGFKDLYGFLAALEGEVTRLEFSPKHEENLVYAVLDQTKYSSGHAKKYANKVKTGLRGKSPAEILEWKKRNPSGTASLVSDSVLQTKNKNPHKKDKGGSKSRSNRQQPLSNSNREGLPTANDWCLLQSLTPEADNRFTLCIRKNDVNQQMKLDEERALYTHFAAYNVIPNSLRFCDKMKYTLLSFPSYFTAYRAWKEKDKAILMGHRMFVQPVAGNLKALTCQFHIVFAMNLPVNVTMSTFVTIFAKFPGLIWINPQPYEHCAMITYSSLESAQRACHEIQYLVVNGDKHQISVRLLESGIDLHSESVRNSEAETKTPLGISSAIPKHAADNASGSDKPAPASSPVVSAERSSLESDVEETFPRGCGFCINYQQYFQMYQLTCRKKLYTVADLPNKVNFLVTHQVDPIRFWGWLHMENHENVKKLNEIEKKLSETAVKIQPPHVLPKEGHRGASCFKNEDGKESWYRCYVLSSDSDADTIVIFYCDYGNSEVIAREQFRSTYNDVWVLPPQAVPFKLNGYELINPESSEKKYELYNLRNLNVFTANIIKDSFYSEKHIIEIKSIRVNLVGSEELDEKLIGTSCKAVGPYYCEKTNESDTHSEVKTDTEDGTSIDSDVKILLTSIFDYDEDDLVLGLLIEAHNPSLVYLKLGDVSQFAILQSSLDSHKLLNPENINKNDILLFSHNGLVRRVFILQTELSMDKVKVLHVDFGTIEWVPMTCLFNLKDDLKSSPFQARPASLVGINCHDLVGAISYLKTHNRLVIKANIIHELESGKVCVELFDPKRGKSLNKELVDLGYATLRSHESYDFTVEDEISPNTITIPISEQEKECALLPSPESKEKVIKEPLSPSETNSFNTLPELQTAPKSKPESLPAPSEISVKPNDSVSVVSWHSHQNNPFQSDAEINDVKNSLPHDNGMKSGKVETWLDQNTSTTNFLNGKIDNESESYSMDRNSVDNSSVCSRTDGDKNINDMKQNWASEKAHLLEIKSKVEGLLELTPQQLVVFYKERKKSKMQQKIRIKQCEKLSRKLEEEHERIIQETNQILSLV